MIRRILRANEGWAGAKAIDTVNEYIDGGGGRVIEASRVDETMGHYAGSVTSSLTPNLQLQQRRYFNFAEVAGGWKVVTESQFHHHGPWLPMLARPTSAVIRCHGSINT